VGDFQDFGGLWLSAACPGRERLEGQGHNEGNYAGTVLGARGIRRICIPGILIKVLVVAFVPVISTALPGAFGYQRSFA
jgi:hypothetical protein